MSTSYIAYYRVSTSRQGESGLGLDAQVAAVTNFCDSNSGSVLHQFREVESGRRRDRPELSKAISLCKKHDAVLLIAKLDRLARNVHFISGLLESGIRFVAVDMPNADRFMMHVYAAVAEEEARRISDRTRSALAAAKTRGVKLGVNGKRLAARHRQEANEFAQQYGSEIEHLRTTLQLSYRAVAEHLNKTQTIPNRNGGKWHGNSVHRLHMRYKQLQKVAICNDGQRYRQATAT